MKVVFRADASASMGSGHIMRCLSLAAELRGQGASVHFLCRSLPQNLRAAITDHGYSLTLLSGTDASSEAKQRPASESEWLETTQAQDAQDSLNALAQLDLHAAWLVVDHYGLGEEWQTRLRGRSRKILVIDDLADRLHDCDILLDQTYGRDTQAYAALVPDHCQVFTGAEFALLRTEFKNIRHQALARRARGECSRIIVSMGGYDPGNLSELVLAQLPDEYATKLEVEIVLGAGAPYLESVIAACEKSPYAAHLSIDVNDMSERLARADLAIGASGTSSWERCCLGLPAMVVTVADNQRMIAQQLAKAGAIHYLGDQSEIKSDASCIGAALTRLLKSNEARLAMSQRAAVITDGLGTYRIAQALLA